VSTEDEKYELGEEITEVFRSTYGSGLTISVHFEPDEARDVLARATFDTGEPNGVVGWLHDVAMLRCRETGWVRIYTDSVATEH
jgi:hypothetical protein